MGRLGLFASLLLAIVGCGGDDAPPGGAIDADLSGPPPRVDADPNAPDAPPGGDPDAPPGQPDAGPPPSVDVQLCNAINERRAQAGLGAIPRSSSVMLVARYHVEDLTANGTGGGSCNLHSWSFGDPRWTGCCYTADHAQAQCMWNKPREIDNHDSNGYEIAAASGGGITPSQAVSLWNGSAPHLAVILNQSPWNNLTWRSLGCAIEGSYAVVWFSELADP